MSSETPSTGTSPDAGPRARWIEPRSGGGARAGPEVRGAETGTSFEVDLEGAPPPEGSQVVLLPGDAPIAWPRGPVPGARAQRGSAGVLRVRPDAWAHAARAGRSVGEAVRAWTHAPLERFRAWWRARFEALAEERAPRGLAQALVLGEASALDAELLERFTRTGTRHLLAVSGLHVGLVAFWLAGPLARLCGRPAAASVLALFAALAGGRAPVVRAVLAASFALWVPRARLESALGFPGARLASAPRRVDGVSLWALALCVELANDPQALGALPVQLSYLATGGILLSSGRLRGRVGAARNTPPELGRSAWRRSAIAVRRGVHGYFSLALAAVLGTLPVAWSTFGEFAPLGIAATALALPPLAAALLVALFTPLLPDAWTAEVLRIAGEALARILAFFDALPGTPWLLPERPAWLLTAAALGLVAARSSKRRGLARGSAAAWGLLLVPWSAGPGELEVHVLDVGHGTCVIARAPGWPALVYDAGSRDRSGLAREAVWPLLRHWEASEAVLVLSHAHVDHAGALGELAERLRVRVWAGVPGPDRSPDWNPDWSPDWSPVRSPEWPTLEAPRGSFGLAPERSSPLRVRLLRGRVESGNEGSVALALEPLPGPGRGAGRHAHGPSDAAARAPAKGPAKDPAKAVLGSRAGALLLGDAEGSGLAALLASGELPGPVGLLLAPHHGSDTPLLGALLERTRPRLVAVSGSIEPPIAGELRRLGIPLFATATDGPLSWSSSLALQLPGLAAAPAPSSAPP